jgi:predicted acylesterase/phospholipase RssA
MASNGPNIAIACQGGGSHAAFSAGALHTLLPRLEADGATLVGISGTSGGAICALLAWYGWLKGGAAEARRLLAAFWASNSANNLAETIWNDAAVEWARALPFEIQFSPNRWPLAWGTAFLTTTWPRLAGVTGNAPAAIRGNFFQLGELVGEGIDFSLVEALGDICSIPADIARWTELDDQGALCEHTQAPTALRIQQRLQAKISAAIDTARSMDARMNAARFGAHAPLRQAFAWAHAPAPAFERARLQAYRATVLAAMDVIPQLLLGAVDIGDGSFVAFSSEKSKADGGISLAAVLASAALPWLFDAVTIARASAGGDIEEHRYWDGLFSQNPPLKNFIADPVAPERKPDEIWLLQINPDSADANPLAKGIADRRNELAGNLSMNQEIAFIKSFNKRLEMLQTGDARLKHMQVDRILLERAVVERVAGRPMDANSKFDRSADLSRALLAHGSAQAARFLLMKPAIANACRELAAARAMVHNLTADAAAILDCLRAITVDADGSAGLELLIDETVSPPSTARGRPDATVRWHAHGMLGGARVRIEGEADFNLGADGQDDAVTLADIAIGSIVRLDAPPADRPALVVPHQGARTPAQSNHAGPH